MGLVRRFPSAAIAVAALAAIAPGCRTNTAPPVLDPAMTACLAAGTTAIAGIDLDGLRASALYRSLPDSVRGLTTSYQEDSRLLVAYDGKAVLVIARGKSGQAPTLHGPPDAVRVAGQQQRSGRTGAPSLVAFAASIAAGNTLWVAARGGVTLPVSGNAANLNRLLAKLEFAGLTIQLDSAAALHFTALGRTTADAREVEENLRAMLSLASAAESRQPEVAALLEAVPVERRERTVTAAADVPEAAVEKLLRDVGH